MDEIQEYISKSKQPVTMNELILNFKETMTESKIKLSLSNLINKKKIETFTVNDETYFIKSTEQNENEINLILSLLKENKNGLTARQIRMKLNLSVNLITKLLRKMELSDKIKSYKGVKGNVKIYTIFDSEGDDLGMFFNEGDVDIELVENMTKIIMRLFHKTENNLSGILNVEDVYTFVKNSNIFQTSIKKTDIGRLLKVMSYDNLIIEVYTGTEFLYLLK